MLGATRPALAPALAVLCLTLTAALSGPANAATFTPPQTATDSLTATVRYVHPDEGGIEVITGFHLALELTYVYVDEGTRVEHEGAGMAIEALEPGDLVTIRYRETERGVVAEAIRLVDPHGEEGGR